jgi:hypothetical protein
MKKAVCLWIFLLTLSAGVPCMADPPNQIGPFILGRGIAEFAAYVDMQSELPIRYLENIKEVEIKPIKGFKSGLIAYGTCAAPGKVVRIKLKYADDSKAFFEALHKKIEARFGKFDEYRGDPFQIVVGWKKSFTDDHGNSISLMIQHNSRDEEEKIGNSIKLTLTNLFDSDCNCQQKKVTEVSEQPIEIATPNPWELFIPRVATPVKP